MTQQEIDETRSYYRSGKSNFYHGGAVYSVVNDLLKVIEKQNKVIAKFQKALALKTEADISLSKLK